eukprot:1149062-Pelagomonas_calceolata.AAC.5
MITIKRGQALARAIQDWVTARRQQQWQGAASLVDLRDGRARRGDLQHSSPHNKPPSLNPDALSSDH